MDRLTIVGVAAIGAGALAVYAVIRMFSQQAIQAVKEEAKVEATNELLTGAADVAAAANEKLAIAGDPGPDSVDATLAAGAM